MKLSLLPLRTLYKNKTNNVLIPRQSSPLFRPHHVIIALGAVATYIGYTGLPLYCPPLILLLPACLYFLSMRATSARQAFAHGWYTGLWGFSASLYWLSVPMTTVGGFPLLLTIPCIMLLGSFLGVYTGLACFCFRGLARYFRLPQSLTPIAPVVPVISDTSAASDTSATPDVSAPSVRPAPSVQSAQPLKFIDQPSPIGQESLELPSHQSSSLLLCCAFPLVAGLCYGGIELACAYVLTGFPWLSLPVSLAAIPLFIQPVNLIGTYGYTAFLVSIVLALCLCVDFRKKIPLVYVACSLSAIIGYGQYSLHIPPSKDYITVGIAQANINQNQKWLPEFQDSTVNKHIDLSNKVIKEQQGDIDLLLWPETAMPIFYQAPSQHRTQINNFAQSHAIPIAFGTLGHGYDIDQNPRLYNRLQLVSAEGFPAGHYDKEHLVPFGEYNPIPFHIPFLDNILQGMNFSAGHKQPLLRLPLLLHTETTKVTHTENATSSPLTDETRTNGGEAMPSEAIQGAPHTPKTQATSSQGTSSQPLSSQGNTLQETLAHKPSDKPTPRLLGSLICYEVIFPALAQERVTQGATLLVTVSNDAWFGKTAAPQQHLNHAVLRAVEQGRSIVRSTTSGYSALILPNGTVHQTSNLYEEAALVVKAPLETRKTVYHTLYPFIDALLLLGLCISFACGIKFRHPEQKFRHP